MIQKEEPANTGLHSKYTPTFPTIFFLVQYSAARPKKRFSPPLIPWCSKTNRDKFSITDGNLHELNTIELSSTPPMPYHHPPINDGYINVGNKSRIAVDDRVG